ncbi:MAG: ammonia-forming cytochrome c nitrite reductase [Bacteroidales bacterium]
MSKENSKKLGKTQTILLFCLVAVVVFLLGILAASITERRSEVAGIYSQGQKVKIEGIEARNRLWGENYPREYETWENTKLMDFKSKHMSNHLEDALGQRPDMVVLWAGYGFAKDYNAPRGHFYAVEDVRNTLRTGGPKGEEDGPMPAACWTCKSPDVPRLMNEMGINEFYNHKWAAHGEQIVNPIGCADCHDPETMNLQISRPALIEAFERQGKDITKATHQEMRSLVCAQCHVEYYFSKEGNVVTFPWDSGFTVEAMEKYYDNIDFVDWTHKLSKTPMLKAQHPDYEIFKMGPHAERGVSCADCHMPYMADGAVKFTDHHLVSPLRNMERTCLTCHKETPDQLMQLVYTRQEKAFELRNRLEELLTDAHFEAKYAWDNGATDAQMKESLRLIRQAQWRWDFGVASHGASFHAPQETERILAHGIDRAHDARRAIREVFYALNIQDSYKKPVYANKAEAQKIIGLDMDKLKTEKKEFLETVVPKWLADAEANNRL